jgi:hypothetical protein
MSAAVVTAALRMDTFTSPPVGGVLCCPSSLLDDGDWS